MQNQQTFKDYVETHLPTIRKSADTQGYQVPASKRQMLKKVIDEEQSRYRSACKRYADSSSRQKASIQERSPSTRYQLVDQPYTMFRQSPSFVCLDPLMITIEKQDTQQILRQTLDKSIQLSKQKIAQKGLSPKLSSCGFQVPRLSQFNV